MITNLALPRPMPLAAAPRYRPALKYQPLPSRLPTSNSPATPASTRSTAATASSFPTPSTATAMPAQPHLPAPPPELLAAVERLWALRQQQPGDDATTTTASPSSSASNVSPGAGHDDQAAPPGSGTGSPTEEAEAEADAYEAALAAAVREVEQLAAAAGFDRVNPELNDGRFRGYTLSGKLRSDLSAGAVTLGRLSFGMYQPQGLLVELQVGVIPVSLFPVPSFLFPLLCSLSCSSSRVLPTARVGSACHLPVPSSWQGSTQGDCALVQTTAQDEQTPLHLTPPTRCLPTGLSATLAYSVCDITSCHVMLHHWLQVAPAGA